MSETARDFRPGDPRSKGAIPQRRIPQDWPKGRRFRILSIDGGGIKGLFPATILAELEQRYLDGASVAGYFDLVAGTSTGGIIALGLGAGLKASELAAVYERQGAEIFPEPTSSPGGACGDHELRGASSAYRPTGHSRLADAPACSMTPGTSASCRTTRSASSSFWPIFFPVFGLSSSLMVWANNRQPGVACRCCAQHPGRDRNHRRNVRRQACVMMEPRKNGQTKWAAIRKSISAFDTDCSRETPSDGISFPPVLSARRVTVVTKFSADGTVSPHRAYIFRVGWRRVLTRDRSALTRRSYHGHQDDRRAHQLYRFAVHRDGPASSLRPATITELGSAEK
jgi:hypothetical protein